MSDKAKNLVRAWQQLRKNRGIIALPEPGWEDWQAVDEAIAVECTVPAPQPTARTAEEKAAKLEELRQSYDCGNMGWSEAVGLYCAWREPKEVPNDEVKSGKYPIARPELPETVSSTEKLVTCKGQPMPHIRIHACREPIVEVEALPDRCTHERLNEDGYCRRCGADMRSGIDLSGHSSVATQKESK
jgi:hypothetical protein